MVIFSYPLDIGPRKQLIILNSIIQNNTNGTIISFERYGELRRKWGNEFDFRILQRTAFNSHCFELSVFLLVGWQHNTRKREVCTSRNSSCEKQLERNWK